MVEKSKTGVIRRIWTRFINWLLPESSAPQVAETRQKDADEYWPRPEVVATQMALADIPGRFSKSVRVRPGWRGLYYSKRGPQTVEPGATTLLDFFDTLRLNFGEPVAGNLLLYDASELAVDFGEVAIELAGPMTDTTVAVTLEGCMVCELADADKFFRNLQKRTREVWNFDAPAKPAAGKPVSAEEVRTLDLARRLLDTLAAGLQERFKGQRYDSLTQAAVETATREILQREMDACGLRFLRMTYVKASATDLAGAEAAARQEGKKAVEQFAAWRRELELTGREQEQERQRSALFLTGLSDLARQQLAEERLKFQFAEDYRSLQVEYEQRKNQALVEALKANETLAKQRRRLAADEQYDRAEVETDLFRKLAQLQQDRVLTAAEAEDFMDSIQRRREDAGLARDHTKRLATIARNGEEQEALERNAQSLVRLIADRRSFIAETEREEQARALQAELAESEARHAAELKKREAAWDTEKKEIRDKLGLTSEKIKISEQVMELKIKWQAALGPLKEKIEELKSALKDKDSEIKDKDREVKSLEKAQARLEKERDKLEEKADNEREASQEFLRRQNELQAKLNALIATSRSEELKKDLSSMLDTVGLFAARKTRKKDRDEDKGEE